MDPNPLVRFSGGSPLRTILWLVFLSLVVGWVFETIGLDPFALVRRVVVDFDRFVDWVLHLGSGAFVALARYALLGAVVVVPVWLISRLMRLRR